MQFLSSETFLSQQQWPTGCLYVVATPIGNLGDITLRALHLLKMADLIAAEDTRGSSELMRFFGIKTPMMAAHEHNEHQAATQIIQALEAGKRVALITDAGSPAVSDPGALVVHRVHEAGYPVVPLPGACAAITALMSSGVDGREGWCFAGFAPTKASARRQWLTQWGAQSLPVIIYEAPHRIQAFAQAASEVMGSDRNVVVCRELTKRFEQVHRCTLGQLPAWLDEDPHHCSGEFVLIVEPLPEQESDAAAQDARFEAFALSCLEEGMRTRTIAKLWAELTGASKNAVYEAVLALKKD